MHEARVRISREIEITKQPESSVRSPAEGLEKWKSFLQASLTG
jgi:hypothetical protein